MKESAIQVLFSKYIKTHNPKYPCAYELKLVNLEKCKSKPFNCVDEHQIESLLAVDREGLFHKIPDTAAINGFTGQKPFDCFFLKGFAYIVPVFYVPRKRKTAYLIRIGKWLEMQEQAERKSFIESMCEISCDEVIKL